MMRCPLCSSVSHIRTSRYITEQTKESNYQCTRLECSCAFKTNESVSKIVKRENLKRKI
ncbi:ogr/Delta-like zinc finger family protein [Rahnella woolbedingensis]|uniref:Transcriptional regulator n=1 Tax=Rahnella woolbedingensis TaxID=1510574 RepID=A0A419N5I0_9GAMM|nr:transcriptional regulator [Rahnella woolbedingensis]